MPTGRSDASSRFADPIDADATRLLAWARVLIADPARWRPTQPFGPDDEPPGPSPASWDAVGALVTASAAFEAGPDRGHDPDHHRADDTPDRIYFAANDRLWAAAELWFDDHPDAVNDRLGHAGALLLYARAIAWGDDQWDALRRARRGDQVPGARDCPRRRAPRPADRPHGGGAVIPLPIGLSRAGNASPARLAQPGGG